MSTFLVIFAGFLTFIFVISVLYNHSKKVESFIDKRLISLIIILLPKIGNYALKRMDKKRKKREDEFNKRMENFN